MTKSNGLMTPVQKIERIAELQRHLSKALLDQDMPVARFWVDRMKCLLDTLPPRRSKLPCGDGIGTEWDLATNFNRKYWGRPDRLEHCR